MSVARSTLAFALGTLISRIFGLVREAVLAMVFGASTLLDSFLVANRIPGLLRDLMAEGALGTSFTRQFSAWMAEDPERARRLAVDTLILCCQILLALIGLGILCAEWLVLALTWFAPAGYAEQLQMQATFLTRMLLPFILPMSLSAILAGILHQRGKFFITAIAPIFTNLGFILGALILGSWFQFVFPESVDAAFADRRLIGLAAGVLIGGGLQAASQFLVVWKSVLSPFVPSSLIPINTDTKKVMKLMLPMIIGASSAQVTVFINTNFAASLGEGVVSFVTLAFRLLQLPIGIFGVAIGSAVLPVLTKKIVQNGGKVSADVSAELTQALELVSWLLLPCGIMLITQADSMVSLLYGGGRFDQDAVSKTAKILSIYGFGLIGYGFTKVLTAFYYAIHRTRFPMYASLFNLGLGLILNLILVPKMGFLGLAVTSATVLLCNGLFLLVGLSGSGIRLWAGESGRNFACLLVATLLAVLGQKFCLDLFDLLEFAAPQKVLDLLAILATGTLVTIAFFALGLVRLKKSPAELWRQAKTKLTHS